MRSCCLISMCAPGVFGGGQATFSLEVAGEVGEIGEACLGGSLSYGHCFHAKEIFGSFQSCVQQF